MLYFSPIHVWFITMLMLAFGTFAIKLLLALTAIWYMFCIAVTWRNTPCIPGSVKYFIVNRHVEEVKTSQKTGKRVVMWRHLTHIFVYLAATASVIYEFWGKSGSSIWVFAGLFSCVGVISDSIAVVETYYDNGKLNDSLNSELTGWNDS